ncbi:hypothetical protein ASPZODRAFT_151906 [Penicilliopsis zonata CBS 506.65]|uniref:Tyrosine-protein phosphatase domain-containing protein n=1 Tax=Penicilliopsis zonata CBS 506.65 TaxID=1073090 RepID=A0A1L9SGP0_9EURO|nr:hypothetical protein ASPZODRAFT_151906 [Penicilliopsis zonata CBS 506.65]OJJ46341.1 hypothetical protein ASPZODRAFT_151906 [Penicilliopsis zonata CBS 506.65]
MRAISIERLSEIIKSPGDETLILDIRPYGHFSEAHIQNALNLCIPTTLLKRPSFDTRKLQATFSAEAEKARFKMWRSCSSIVVYDTTTSDKRDAGQLLNVLKKFTAEGWKGEGCYLKGGFAAFANRFPELIQQHSHQGSTHKKQPSMDIQLPSTLPIAGGCALPKTSTVVNPFFGNIRQNMDLVGGVGQIAVKLPKGLTESNKKSLPAWLRAASDAKDQGLGVSKKFLALETKELDRMRQALSVDNVCVNTPSSEPQGKYRVAGIEKGTKNRYNDIYPFDHSRVRLQDVPTGDCDYVNASHIHTKYSNKRYIATQAPVPDTFNDFWRVVWEQDVRVIVSLTAEVERGHVKCHPYWKSGNYGPLKLKCFAERQIEVESADHSPIGLRCVPNPVRCDPSLDPFAAGNSPHDRSREASDDPVIIDLFRLFLKRCARQLYGAQYHSSCKLFAFQPNIIDVRASSFANSGDLNLALVTKESGLVHLFSMRDCQVFPQGEVRPPWDHPGSEKVFRTSFDGKGGIYVLQSSTLTGDHVGSDDNHPFVKHALQTGPSQSTYLVHYDLQSVNPSVQICTFPDNTDYEPLALGAADDGAFAISWKKDNTQEVVLYTDLIESDADDSGISHIDYESWTILSEHERGPVMDIIFNDRNSQLLYFHRAQALYGSFQKIDPFDPDIEPKLYDNSCLVPFSNSTSLYFSIGIPFFGTHETDASAPPNLSPPMCTWKYLALGIAKHREANWTVACLLKSEARCRATNCEHVLNLDRGRRFSNWTVVARLWGFQEASNSLGCIVATSQNGRRLAIANWNKILVWAFEPSELIEQNSSGFYPPNFLSETSGMVKLRPVVLQTEAVCFKMRFMENENHLVALTDHGLMYWDLQSLGTGARTTHGWD